MRLQTIDITCPKCKHKPTIKKYKLDDDVFYYLECGCTKSAAWNEIYNAISSWVLTVGKMGAFDWILKIHTEINKQEKSWTILN